MSLVYNDLQNQEQQSSPQTGVHLNRTTITHLHDVSQLVLKARRDFMTIDLQKRLASGQTTPFLVVDPVSDMEVAATAACDWQVMKLFSTCGTLYDEITNYRRTDSSSISVVIAVSLISIRCFCRNIIKTSHQYLYLLWWQNIGHVDL